MEHRWSVRTPITTQVTLHRHNQPVAVCAASDIGLGGLFIETGPLTYPTHTIFEVDLELNTDQGPKRFHLRTCVIYSSEAGLGLMFLDSDHVVSRSIRQLLLDGVCTKAPMHEPGLAPTAAVA